MKFSCLTGSFFLEKSVRNLILSDNGFYKPAAIKVLSEVLINTSRLCAFLRNNKLNLFIKIS